MDGMPSVEQLIELSLQDTADPEVRVRILSYRVATLTREKEALEVKMAGQDARLKKIEDVMMMGKGVFWLLPILGLILGYIMANWGWLTRPWTPTQK